MLKFGVTILIALVLTACGGGGGGGSDPAPPASSASQAVNDTGSTNEETAVTLNPTANDISVSPSTIAISSNPTNGTATISGTSIVYQPDTDFSGSDSFQYQVTGTDGVVRTANVSIAVNGVNDAPVAISDTFTVTQNTPTALALTGNDTDIDSAITSVTIGTTPTSGSVSVSGTEVTYTPALDFVGADSFTYSVMDGDGANSNAVQVTLTVEPISTTVLQTAALTIPVSSYTATNNVEIGATVLASPMQSFEVPPNTVSFVIALEGADAGTGNGQLFISELITPSGASLVPFQRGVNFCDGGLCSTLVPRNDDFTAESGTWQLSLGTIDSALNNVNFDSLTLNISMRVGPTPDLTQASPARLNIKPFVSATTPNLANMQLVLNELAAFGVSNGITMNIAPFTVVADSRFARVPGSFRDSLTGELVGMGDPTQVNLFFVESFSGSGGSSLLGVAGGIPGPMGLVSPRNGVLVNASAFFSPTDLPSWSKATAEIAFHEMGHYLGLYHTTEQRFSQFDVLSDTPECVDTNGDSIAGLDECADGLNLMFWNSDFIAAKQTLSLQQRRVLYFSPIALPGS